MKKTVPVSSRWAEKRSTVVYGTLILVLITYVCICLHFFIVNIKGVNPE